MKSSTPIAALVALALALPAHQALAQFTAPPRPIVPGATTLQKNAEEAGTQQSEELKNAQDAAKDSKEQSANGPHRKNKNQGQMIKSCQKKIEKEKDLTAEARELQIKECVEQTKTEKDAMKNEMKKTPKQMKE